MEEHGNVIRINSGGRLNIKMSSYQDKTAMLKIRRFQDRLIFNMGISIPGKYGIYIETGPRTRFMLLPAGIYFFYSICGYMSGWNSQVLHKTIWIACQ